ncbi:hypothetical protein ACNKHK_22030 [Shigella flexneri]
MATLGAVLLRCYVWSEPPTSMDQICRHAGVFDQIHCDDAVDHGGGGASDRFWLIAGVQMHRLNDARL